MTKPKRIKAFVFLGVAIFAALFIIVGNKLCSFTSMEVEDMVFYTANVAAVGEASIETYNMEDGSSIVENKQIPFNATFTSGPNKNDSFNGIQEINSMFAAQPREVEAGQKIIVSYELGLDASESRWIYVEHNRSNYLLALFLVFLCLIILIGRSKGFGMILSLCYITGAIFLVYIPSILKGFNVYLSTIIICAYIILVSLIIMNGANRKTLCAILGNVGGVLVAGLLAILMNHLLNITGFIDEEYIFLTMMDSGQAINLRAVIWGSIVIGSLGAIMDVAMSIASAMNELAEHMERKSFSRLLKSGMNIGIDSIGTMTSTLILAYIGGSLAMVLLLIAYNKNLLYLFNLEMIVVEVIQAIIGSMGILFAVPLTALISAYIYHKEPSECSNVD